MFLHRGNSAFLLDQGLHKTKLWNKMDSSLYMPYPFIDEETEVHRCLVSHLNLHSSDSISCTMASGCIFNDVILILK